MSTDRAENDPFGPAQPKAPGSWVGGCLRTLGWLAVIAVVVVTVGIGFLYWSVSSSYRAPKAYPAPVAWEHRTVTLSRDEPSAGGRFSIGANGAQSSATVGVTAGVPKRAAGGPTEAGPAALLIAPAVRVTLGLADGQTLSCDAPCELSASTKYDCTSGGCEVTGAVEVDLLGPDSDEAPSVTVDIAAGMSGSSTQGLPDGTTIDLEIDGAPRPEAS